jgi:ATP-binding cassette subfamily F protein 3
MAQAVKSKQQSLDRLKSSPAISFSSAKTNELIPEPPKDKRFRFRFPPIPRCGQSVFEVTGVDHGYRTSDDSVNYILKGVDLQIDKGDRIGIVGRNGIGKSTLLRLLANMETPLKGAVNVGSATVKMGFFSQNQADSLSSEDTVVEAIQHAVLESSESGEGYMSITDIRNLLGQFMFKGETANKQIHMLSGGEKSRVSLCRLLVSPSNVLLLDEPTNHLDIVSKVVLEDALLHFEGTLVVVSHDRHFMSKVVNKIVEFEDSGNVVVHYCDYHDYLKKKVSLKEKITQRYVQIDGVKRKIENVKLLEVSEQAQRTKNFGGSGVTSGNSYKGIKNARRFIEK